MSQKIGLKPKITTVQPFDTEVEKEVIIPLPVKVESKIRTLVPEPPAPKEEPKTEENDEVDEDDEGDDDGEDEKNVEQSGSKKGKKDSKKSTKRKQRTKKVYPPSDELFNELIQNMCDLRDLTRKIITLSKDTQRSIKKEHKDFNVRIKKEKSEKEPRKPRGFALPSPVSDEMVDYLLNVAKIPSVDRKIDEMTSNPVKIEKGCLLARNELTAALCNHFKSSQMRKNDLDKRDIHLDEKTAKLFNIDPKKFGENGGRLSQNGEPIITYFDLQKYLPRHCGKLATEH